MKAVAAIVALLALLACPQTIAGRDLMQGRTSTDCAIETSSSIKITSGSGFSTANTFCMAEAEATERIQETIQDWVTIVMDDPETGCSEFAAAEISTTVAEAITTAYVGVTNTVEIKGTGKACAKGFAAGEALAVALLEITVNTTIDAIRMTLGEDPAERIQRSLSKSVNQKTGDSAQQSVVALVSSASARASNATCTTGKFREGFERSFAEQAREAISFLFTEVIVTLCKEQGFSPEAEEALTIAGVMTFQDGGIDEITAIDEMFGDGTTESMVAKPCPGLAGAICCRESQKAVDKCRCGAGCEMVAFTGDGPSNGKLWEDASTGDVCLCP